MKKTILLAVIPLILIVTGCNKSDSNSSCTYNAESLKGKQYRLQSETVDSASIRNSTTTYNDSFQYSYSFSDGNKGLLIVKYQLPNQPLVEYTKEIDYTVLSGSSDIQIVEWNSSTSKNTYLYKVESFDCTKMVLYTKTTLGTTLYEQRLTFIKQ